VGLLLYVTPLIAVSHLVGLHGSSAKLFVIDICQMSRNVSPVFDITVCILESFKSFCGFSLICEVECEKCRK
jgi:hypothetical protein